MRPSRSIGGCVQEVSFILSPKAQSIQRYPVFSAADLKAFIASVFDVQFASLYNVTDKHFVVFSKCWIAAINSRDSPTLTFAIAPNIQNRTADGEYSLTALPSASLAYVSLHQSFSSIKSAALFRVFLTLFKLCNLFNQRPSYHHSCRQNYRRVNRLMRGQPLCRPHRHQQPFRNPSANTAYHVRTVSS